MAETLSITVRGHTMKVSNNVNPVYMLATTENVQFLVNELVADVRGGIKVEVSGSSDDSGHLAVVCDDDSDDDSATQELIARIADIKKSKDDQ